MVVLPGILIVSHHLETHHPGNDYIVSQVDGSAAVRYQVSHPISSGQNKSKPYRQFSEWIPLEKGMKLSDGGTLKTGSQTRLDIMLTQGSALRLHEKSQIRLQRDTAGKQGIEVTLSKGRVLCRVSSNLAEHQGKPAFRVATPSALAQVRGTSFGVHYSPELKITKVEVLEGLVNLKALNNPAVEIDLSEGKKGHMSPYHIDPFIGTVSSEEQRMLLETDSLQTETDLAQRWTRMVEYLTASPIYRQALLAIAKYEMKTFIRSINYHARLRWNNQLPHRLEEVELEDGDYRDPWDTPYHYDRITSKRAALISAGPDRRIHTHDDLFMPISL